MDDARDAAEVLFEALCHAPRRALLSSELAAAGRGAGLSGRAFERGLDALRQRGQIVVLDHAPPDVHLHGADLRTVGATDEPSADAMERARRNAAAHWDDFVRAFLASHRCS